MKTRLNFLVSVLVAIILFASFAAGQTPEEFEDLKRRVEAIEKLLEINPPDPTPPDPVETITVEWPGGNEFTQVEPWEQVKQQAVKLSRPIEVEAGAYTHHCQIKAEGGPAFVTFPFTCYDASGRRIGNANQPSTGEHAVHGDWRIAAGAVEFPQGTKTVRVKSIKRINDTPIDVMGFALSKGVSFPHNSPTKKPFEGTTSIDADGNVTYKGERIVPFCMYVNKRRTDWRVYSDAGWNVNMWCSTANECQRSIDAGLIPSVSLAWYTFGGAKGDTPEEGAANLRAALREIKRRGIVPIWLYLDNEHQRHAEGLERIRLAVKVCREEMPQVPTYFLNGQYGTANLYAQYGWQDITGTYVGSQNTGGQGVATPYNVLNIERQQGQTSPVVVGQLNQSTPRRTIAQFKENLNRSWDQGARGFGYWRRDPVESAPWWSESKSIIDEFVEGR